MHATTNSALHVCLMALLQNSCMMVAYLCVVLCMRCAHRINSFQNNHMHDAWYIDTGSVWDLYDPEI